ncbi:unnamed protein product [Cuscuta campestris]|uniref:Uncharacterized protein n=1 Tax=Cuscuta campestris TaxID=132261 RepID=A0A484KZF1_9ASTE|nr:unnamed protein product [Cuscuta campestris]
MSSVSPIPTSAAAAASDHRRHGNNLAADDDGASHHVNFEVPPESFWVAKDSEADWLYQNATMQRKSSLKLARSTAAAAPSTRLHHHHHHQNTHAFSRRSLSTLNHATTTTKSNGSLRHTAAAARLLFRSRSEPGGKGLAGKRGVEPDSPLVSCTGRVRTKREGGGRRTGLWKTLRTALKGRFGGRRPQVGSKASSESAGSMGMESGRWSES